jgi:hypothetical protein
MNDEKRRANRRVALIVLLGMIILAVVAVIFTLATVEWRRKSDVMRPDMPSFGQNLLISLGLFAIAVALVGAIVLWLSRRKE